MGNVLYLAAIMFERSHYQSTSSLQRSWSVIMLQKTLNYDLLGCYQRWMAVFFVKLMLTIENILLGNRSICNDLNVIKLRNDVKQ